MDNICLIVNKTAGSGRCAALFERAEAALKARGAEFTVLTSEYHGHAVKLAKEAVERGERLIVAAGGDGTVNEVSSVLMDVPDATLGILPFGTGNDIAEGLGIPASPEAAVNVLFNGTGRKIDMGLANGRPFINASGFGFDVDVILNTERYKNGRGSMLPYLMGILVSLFKRQRIPVVIETDEGSVETNILVAVAGNGTRFGGGMRVTPEARPDDGLFDICVIESLPLIKLLFLLPFFTKGRHIGKKPVRYFKAARVRFDTDKEYPVQLDGEITQMTPVEYVIRHKAVNILLPQNIQP